MTKHLIQVFSITIIKLLDSTNVIAAVFWMHHCQIDRLFAIWQKINPDSWFPTNPVEINALTRARAYFDPKVPLEPFRSTATGATGALGDKGWWTCNTAQYTKTFGYSYADTDVPNPLDNFMKKYAWSFRQDKTGPFGKCPDNMLPWDTTKAQIYQFTQAELKQANPSVTEAVFHAARTLVAENSVLKSTLSKVASNGATQESLKTEVVPSDRAFASSADDMPEAKESEVDESAVSRSWYIDMLVERYATPVCYRSTKLTARLRLALNGSFSVNFFTGPFGDDPWRYYAEKELAGSTNVFAAPVQACDNCGRDREKAVLVSDTADITPILLDYHNVGQLQSLAAKDVVPFLKDRLKWRVVTVCNK
jgi:tyrosinase